MSGKENVVSWAKEYATLWSATQKALATQFATGMTDFKLTIPGTYLTESGFSPVTVRFDSDGDVCTILLDWQDSMPFEMHQVDVPEVTQVSLN